MESCTRTFHNTSFWSMILISIHRNMKLRLLSTQTLFEPPRSTGWIRYIYFSYRSACHVPIINVGLKSKIRTVFILQSSADQPECRSSRPNMHTSSILLHFYITRQSWSWSEIICSNRRKDYRTGLTNYNAIDKTGLESDMNIACVWSNNYLLYSYLFSYIN